MTFLRYEPSGTFRLSRARLAGVTKESVLNEVAVAVEFFRDRGVRVTVYPDDAEASDMHSLSGSVTRREESKNSSMAGKRSGDAGGEVCNIGRDK